jgi:integrase
MSEVHPTAPADAGNPVKPNKPSPVFPLTAHPAGYWCRQGRKLFTAEEVRRLIDTAGTQMKAMLLLAINCGFGNADCGTLPLAAVDLDRRVIDYPRPKTGAPRRCGLWPETVAALKGALAARKEPKDKARAGVFFVTRYGQSWSKTDNAGPHTQATRELLNRLGIDGHRNFYTLRHTFRTVADGAKDQPAADYIMGHEVSHRSSVYREAISDERLQAVTDHVRQWLFAEPKAPGLPADHRERRGGVEWGKAYHAWNERRH